MSASDTFLRATITARIEIARDLWKIRVDPGGAFPFTAGQYATLGVPTSQGLVERAYSIVSSPYERELEFYFELVPNGELTPLLYQRTTGDSLSIRKRSKGRFVLDQTSGRTNHLLLCTVTGIAPFISYARTLKKEWDERLFKGDHRLFLLQGASHASEFAYRDEIESLARAVPWLTYVPAVSRPWDDADWRGERGRVDELIREYADRWSLNAADTTAYLCGHPEMIAHGKEILRRAGWEKNALREESYFVPAASHA
jgi:ferredoxin--NADP+ reductase